MDKVPKKNLSVNFKCALVHSDPDWHGSVWSFIEKFKMTKHI